MQVASVEHDGPVRSRRQVVIAIAVVVVVTMVSVLAAVSQYAGAKQQLVSQAETAAERFETVFREAVESRLQSLRLGAEILARDEGIVGAFARRDRADLAQRTVGFYNETLMPRFGLSILGFQTPEGIMFFRAHRPSLLGDDASGRTAVVRALKSRVSISGIELGRIGPELRALTPIVQQDTLIGSVELGSGVLEPLQIAARATGLDFAFAVDEALSEALDRPRNARTDVLRGGALYFTFSSPDARATLEQAGIDPSLTEPRTLEAAGQTIFAKTIPINDIGGRPVTRITVLRNLSAPLKALHTSILLRTALIGAVVLAVFLFGLFRFRSLRAGLERSFAGRLQELRDKAQAYDAVRQRLRDVDAWKVSIVSEFILLLKDPLIAVQGAIDEARKAAATDRNTDEPSPSSLDVATTEIRRLRAALDSQFDLIGLRNGWCAVASEPVMLGSVVRALPSLLSGGTSMRVVGDADRLQVVGDQALLRSAFTTLFVALGRRAEMDMVALTAEPKEGDIFGSLAGSGRWRGTPPRLDDIAPLGALAAGQADDGLATARAAFERLGGSLDLVTDEKAVGFTFRLRAA